MWEDGQNEGRQSCTVRATAHVIALTLILLVCATRAWAEDRAGWAFFVEYGGTRRGWAPGTPGACAELRSEFQAAGFPQGPCLPVTLGEPGGGVAGWSSVFSDGFMLGSDPTICQPSPPEAAQARPVAESCPRASLRLPI